MIHKPFEFSPNPLPHFTSTTSLPQTTINFDLTTLDESDFPAKFSEKFKKQPLPLKTRRTPEITLVLDLDETLVHASLKPLDKADLTFNVEMPDGVVYVVYVKLRPGLVNFLEKISSKFELVLFTASKQIYADKLIGLLDKQLGKQLIKHRLYRDHCRQIMQSYVKDLAVLGRDIKKVLIVDNSPQAFCLNMNNGIPIKSWFGEDGDTELDKLEVFLDDILALRKKVKRKSRVKLLDLRKVVLEKFSMQERVERLFFDRCGGEQDQVGSERE